MPSRSEVALCLSPDCCLDVFDIHNGAHLKSVPVAASSFALLHDSLVVCTSAIKGKAEIAVWNYRFGRLKWKCRIPSAQQITSVAVLFGRKLSTAASASLGTDARFLVAGTNGGVVYCWCLLSGHLVAVFKAHLQAISGLSFSSDGSLLVSWSKDCLIKVWKSSSILCSGNEANAASQLGASAKKTAGSGLHTANVREYRVFKEHILSVNDVLLCAGNDRLVSCSDDRSVKVYSIRSGLCLSTLTFPTPLSALCCDPCLTWLIVGSKRGHLYRINLCEYPSLKSGHSLGTASIEAMIESDASIVLCDETAADVSETGGDGVAHHSADTALKQVTALDVSFDGRLCVAAHSDGTATLWDLLYGSQCRALTKHRAKYSAVALICDRLAAFGSSDDCPEIKHEKGSLLARQWPAVIKRLFTSDQNRRVTATRHTATGSGHNVSLALPCDEMNIHLGASLTSASELGLTSTQRFDGRMHYAAKSDAICMTHPSADKFGMDSYFTDEAFMRNVDSEWNELELDTLSSFDCLGLAVEKKSAAIGKDVVDSKVSRKRKLVQMEAEDCGEANTQLLEENRLLKGEIQEWRALHQKLFGFTTQKVLGIDASNINFTD